MAAVARAVVVLSLIAVNLRTLLGSFGAAGTSLEQLLPGGGAAVGLTSSISIALIAVGAPVSALLVRRRGLDHAVVAALVTTAVALVLLSVGTPTTTWAAALLGGLAAGILGALLPALAQTWLPRSLGTAIGVMMAATSLGLALASVLVSRSLTRWDTWSPATLSLAAVAVVAVVVYSLTTRRGAATRAVGDEPTRTESRPPRATGASRRLPRWAKILTAFLALQSFVLFAQIAWLAPSLETAGSSATHAGAMLGLFSALQVVAALAATAYAQRRGHVGAMLSTASVVTVTGSTGLLVALGASSAPHWWTIASIALGHGASFALVNFAIAQRSPEPRSAAATGAVVMFVSQGIGALGPVLTGALRDTAGSTSGAWLLLVALGAAQSAVAVTYAIAGERRAGRATESAPKPEAATPGRT